MKGKSKKVKGQKNVQSVRDDVSHASSLLTFAFLLLPLLSGCGGVQSVLNPVGPQAERISRLWWLMLYVCTAVFIIVIISVFVAVYRSRQNQETASDAAHITPEPRSEQRMGES